MSNFKRETSISVSKLHDDSTTITGNFKKLAISFDGIPQSQSNSSRNTSPDIRLSDINQNNYNQGLPSTIESQITPDNSISNMEYYSKSNEIINETNNSTDNVDDSINFLNDSQFSFKSIMSSARTDFSDKYDLIKEIGRGGFSTVFQCREKRTNLDYAVKIIDLRPLRLRERFNPSRIRREVDIMRRLTHPNIIQFVQVFETQDHLMMVMEYCPGDELFDVILERKYFSEEDAKPIFAQVAKALYYLHCLNIIHRDVKPENILILHNNDPITGLPIAKLLDFGLSKEAGAGSAAKTFVGTPCYLSPEVEYTSKGLGGTYGLPADCWSLGAVLYVMLVARFPEFEKDNAGKVVLRLPPSLWQDISSEVKDLIRSLMNTNPGARCTVRKALQHPWLGEYRLTDQELTNIALESYDFGQGLQGEEEEASRINKQYSDDEMTAGGQSVHRQAMVLRINGSSQQPNLTDQLQLAPLLNLQRSIAACFEESLAAYSGLPEVATKVRQGADLCRKQVTETSKMLRKVEQTAKQVLHLFQDLELAIEEEEPKLAENFFNTVRGWVVELRDLVIKTQSGNNASMSQIQSIVEQTTIGLQDRQNKSNSHYNKQLLMEKITNSIQKRRANNNNNNDDEENMEDFNNDPENFSVDEVLELFMGLFGSNPLKNNRSPRISSGENGKSQKESFNNNIDDIDEMDGVSHQQTNNDDEIFRRDSSLEGDIKDDEIQDNNESKMKIGKNNSLQHLFIPNNNICEETVIKTLAPPSPVAAEHLAEALRKLHQVDLILEQLSTFWANTEVVLDVLTKKGQHVEQFIAFAHKPKILARFKERMDEYKVFWEGICSMCSNYMSGIQQQQHVPDDDNHRMYGFLEKGNDEFQSTQSSSSSNNRRNGVGSNTKPSSFESFGSPGNDFWDLN